MSNQLIPSDVETKPNLKKITPADIKPVVPEDGGSVFVFGINASDKKNRELPGSHLFGALDEGQAKQTEFQYKNFADRIFEGLPPKERAKIDILVIAGNANLRMPGGVNNHHKRSVETAEHILTGIRDSMAEYGVNSNQLLNKAGRPIELTSGKLIDLEMWEKSPEFVKFLHDKYGDSKELWEAFEEDRHRDVREKMGAEGPNEIANRVGDYMATLDHAMKLYHIEHPGRKVVVILNTQYDSAAPMIKKFVSEQPLEDYLEIEKRGGIVFEVSADGAMSTDIQGHKYPVSFRKETTDADALKEEQGFFALPEKITSKEMLKKLRSEPLDPGKIEKVVNKFAEKHIQHKHGEIIFVGSGSGKSYTVRNQTPNEQGKTDIVDADFLYRETGAHPLIPTKPGEPLRTFPWWFMEDEVIHEVEKRCALVNEAIVRKGLWALTSSFRPEDPYVPSNIVVALIPWAEHRSNMVKKFKGGHYDGGVRATYDGFRIALGHRKWAEEVSNEKKIPLVSSIKEAIELVRSRELT